MQLSQSEKRKSNSIFTLQFITGTSPYIGLIRQFGCFNNSPESVNNVNTVGIYQNRLGEAILLDTNNIEFYGEMAIFR